MHAIPEYALDSARFDSGELVDALAALSDVTVAGRAKFGSRACRQVALAICCRNYAKAVHELCHMVVFADAASDGRGWEEIFWNNGPATAANFRATAELVCREGPNPVAEFDSSYQAATLRYRDGEFSISFSRMPFLSALLEFLVSGLGYRAVDDLFAPLFETGPSSAGVSNTAKALCRTLYAYLADHLPSVQAQRNFRRLVRFLEARDGKAASIDAIDDAAVLEFWRRESVSHDGGRGDFKTFRQVFRSFVRLYQALDAAQVRNALNRPRSIGPDRAHGEIDPDRLIGIVEAIGEQRNALDVVRDDPAGRIKFFNRREARELELLFDCGPCVLTLPLSLMRAEVFSAEQSRITQALRNGAGDVNQAVTHASRTQSYDQRRQQFQNLCAHLFRIQLASLHVLARARHRTAISMVLGLRPDADYSRLANLFPNPGPEDDGADGGNVVVLDSDLIRDRFFAALVELEHGDTVLGKVFREARAAFGKLSRQGFRTRDIDDPDVIDGFAAAADPLFEINDHLAKFCVRLDRVALPHGTWADQFEADRAVFNTQFELLYGDAR
jgi:CTP:molybdopterin cytidylyltransferase MocA